MTITFSPESNTLSSNITVRDVQGGDGATSAYNLGFGFDPGDGSDGYSAYINDLNYAAIERPNFSSVLNNGGTEYQQTKAAAYLISGDQIDVTSYFPETFTTANESGHRPFCNNCDFIKWGAWGARVEFGSNSNPAEYVDNIHLGWWAAGNVASASDLQDLGNLYASATYNGHVFGNVANGLNDDWKTYTATGDLLMTWDFADRTGLMTISQFDRGNFGSEGLTFEGSMCAPGNSCGSVPYGNHFGGNISGSLPNDTSVRGSASGAFVNDGAKQAAGIMGNWNVGNSHYKAGGIFAGAGTPVQAQ